MLRYKLENGLTVLLLENHFAPVAAINVWVNVGSADETPEEAGLAHVHEHMLFKGTKRRGLGQIASEVEGAGGDINAFTSIDETVYFITIPSRNYKLGLDILSDAVYNSSFDAGELKKELQVVLEEIKRGEDNPSTKLYHELFKTTYKVHPYGRPIIGTEETVSGFTRDDVTSFYRKWYTPDNMVLVVVGDFNEDEAKRAVAETFGGKKRPGRKTPPLKNHRPEPAQKASRVTVVRGDVKETYMDMAFHIPSVVDEDIPALDVLSHIIGSGEASRLYRKVQAEKGLVNSVYSYTLTPHDPGLFLFGATLDGKNLPAAVEAILEQAALLKTELVSTKELNNAKTNLESDAVYSRETVQGQARKLGFFETIVGDVDYEKKYLSAVSDVTAEDLRYVARKYFTPENATLAAYIPQSLTQKGLDEEALARLIKKTLALRITKTDEREVTVTTLSNGVKVIVKENHAVPIVAIRAASLGGLRFESEENLGISNFIARTLTKGTARRSAEEIAAQMESIAGGIGGFSGRDSIGLSADFLSRRLDEGVDIFADALLNATFPSREVEQQRREILAAIQRVEDNPDQLTVNLFKKTLFPKHPYGNMAIGDAETVRKLSRKDLLTYYRSLLSPRNMVISVVGDVRTEEVISKLENALAGLENKAVKLPAAPKPTAIRTVKKAEISRDKEQAQIVIGFRGASFKSDDRYALDVLAAVLGGQGGRLFLELRDKKHLAYSVSAYSVEALDAGYFLIYMGTRPENREKAVEGIMAEVEQIRSELVNIDELRRAREYVAGGYEISMQTNSSQAMNIALNELYGMGWETIEEYPRRIREVTAGQVLEVARKYLTADRYVIAVLMPPGGDSE